MVESKANGSAAGQDDFTRIAQDLASSSTKRRIQELGIIEKQLVNEGQHGSSFVSPLHLLPLVNYLESLQRSSKIALCPTTSSLHN